jgi:hypothetical protein
MTRAVAWEHWTSRKKDVLNSELMAARMIGAGISVSGKIDARAILSNKR